MTASPDSAAAFLDQVATYLTARREALLTNWRTACENDPTLKGVRSLSREEFNNKVPFMLNVLQQQLRAQPQDVQVDVLAAEHGLHRWQKGYTLAELLAEMQHLGQVMHGELSAFWPVCNPPDSTIIPSVYAHLATFSSQITKSSVSQFVHLQRLAAYSRVEALEKALSELKAVEQQRSEILRQSSHDLRANFGARIYMPGRRCICPVRAGLALIRHPAC